MKQQTARQKAQTTAHILLNDASSSVHRRELISMKWGMNVKFEVPLQSTAATRNRCGLIVIGEAIPVYMAPFLSNISNTT